MWLVGIALLLGVASAIVVWVGWTPRRTPSASLWDIPSLAGPYTGIIGTLAGFSIASAIFVANLNLVAESSSFPPVIGMLFVSFLVLVPAAMMYGSTPDPPAPDEDDDGVGVVLQRLSNLLANGGYYLGLALSWLALRPLLVGLRLPTLAETFTWVLLVTVVAGGMRLDVWLYRLTAANATSCLAVPVVGLVLPVLYRLASVHLAPWLWPTDEAIMALTLVVFGMAGVGFALQSSLLVVHDDRKLCAWLLQHGHRVALAYVEATVALVVLVWLAVAYG